MPINRVLEGGKYTPEEIEILNEAFNLALRSMGLVDRNDPLCEMVARKVVEASRTCIGEPKDIAETAVARIALR
ncbi:hypothetical protein MTX26_27855 [Bradyrhizobium sp. ISRA443]|uniref:hypothetical protein n=1 Tax=unclassified Bradyrhizobium TaxID=2631580 RepID=UPI002478C7EC|nr:MULTISPECIES: hypothetical protein [unclassified Bradyrhizobium]WGR93523.1 hypothetical protein MTX20_02720 [Bradyrhizobium sp. ISRA435]WGR98074.1 hypothetical protein MTX23_27845 [Bradyrhizobium sp. ISRA436]WGS04963.1 hypothetical protein MTX18_27850 [Bradyrhizobium sp. ISRA437]WGS11847.1 hypothetical protein MTX26_27855 [Bradyrhizobium sp. ISRA443]